MIDVGGGSLKLMVSGRREVRRLETGEDLSPQDMVERVKSSTADWRFNAISIGYPGLVHDGAPAQEPLRVGKGWVRFDYAQAFGKPVRIINDAAMQALAAYRGYRMLFVGLGTGLGSALITDNVLIPLELGELRFDRTSKFFERLSEESLEKIGRARWRTHVIQSVRSLTRAFAVSEVVLGGGNSDDVLPLPKHWRARTNAQAFAGAVRLWGDRKNVLAAPAGAVWLINGIRAKTRRVL
jgi:polyphosphate glucokinase